MKRLMAVGRMTFPVVLILLMTSAMFVGCSIKSPQAPSWDTTVRVPLINRTYSSGELFDKLAADNIKTDSAGNTSFYVEKSLDTVSVRDVLSVSGSAADFSKQVGLITIQTPPVMSQQIAFADYLPLIAGVVPDTGMQVATTVGPTNTFSQATIATGGLIVSASNNTGFALDSLAGDLRATGGALLGSFRAPGGLADGSSFVDTIALAGKTIYDQSDCTVYFHTPGGLALSLADRSIDLQFSFTNDLAVNSVTGKVDQFSHAYDQRSLLTNEMHLESAIFASGTLDFSITNHLAVGAQLTVTFPEITSGGTQLLLDLTVGANATVHQARDLAGWSVQPQNDSLQAHLVAGIQSSGGAYVTVNSTDDISFHYDLGNLALESASGIIEPTQIDLNNQQVSIDVPSGFENVSLALVELEVTVLNHSELSGDVAVELQASNGKHLTVTGRVTPGSALAPSTNHISNDQLADLLSPIPSSITISGFATVGDGMSTVHVSSGDFLTGSAVISAPMALKYTETTVEGDKSHIDVDADIADRADRLQHGVFRSTVTNHLPMGAQVTIYIGADSATIFTNPLTTIGPVGFSGAAVDGNGLVTSDAVSEQSIELTAENLQVFTNRSLYVAPIVTLPGTNDQIVRVRASDYFDINGIVEISARVGGEDF